MHHSVSKNQQVRKYDHLHKDIEADVCIIGGGITGISTALNLRNSGLKVVLLEAMQMGSGTTGFSSNHLNTQIDFSYQEVIKIHSLDKARMVSQSRAWAINSIEDTIKELNISCGFERIDGYLYAENAENAEFIQKEAEACQKAGVASSLTDQLPLPINQHKTLLFPDQGFAFISNKVLRIFSTLSSASIR